MRSRTRLNAASWLTRSCISSAARRRPGNKFVLTSRIVGYREVRPAAEGLAEATLVDFEQEEIESFVNKWTTAIEQTARGRTPVAVQEAAQQRAELLAAVDRNSGVRRLASNPLLLTILALMKRQGVTLPERRVELYRNYVRHPAQTLEPGAGPGASAGADLDMVETLKVLAPLALWMHETSPGVGLVKQEELRRQLEAIYADARRRTSGSGGSPVSGRRTRPCGAARGARSAPVRFHSPDFSRVPGGGRHRSAGTARCQLVVDASVYTWTTTTGMR